MNSYAPPNHAPKSPWAGLATHGKPDHTAPHRAQAPGAQPGATFEQLDAIAQEYSDNEAARRLNQARATLFQHINHSQPAAA